MTGSAVAAPGDITATLVSNINTSAPFAGSSPSRLVSVGGTILFSADDGTGVGRELWKSDGTPAGTTRLGDINPSGDGLSSGTDLVNVNGTVFFAGFDGTELELYKVEAPYSAPPTEIEINATGGSSPQDLANFNGTLFFEADDGSAAGRELWKSNGGTVASGGTTRVADINTTGDSLPEQLTPVGSTLFFVASDGNDGGVDGKELWKTDGTINNKTELEINTATDEGSDPTDLTNAGGTLFLAAQNDTVGRELWKAQESDASATPIDIVSGSTGSDLDDFGAVGGTLFFRADDGTNGQELWKSNGGTVLSGGTAMVADINPGPVGSIPEEPIAFNGMLFFAPNDGSYGQELWRTNGGPLGAGNTERVADINPGLASSFPTDPVLAAGALWFRATSAAAGDELWKTDGTTVRTADIRPGSLGSGADEFAAGNGALLFAADDGTTTGRELWKATIEPSPPAPPAAPGTTPGTAKKKKCKKKKEKKGRAAAKKCKKKKKK